jgi:hypothetical protein
MVWHIFKKDWRVLWPLAAFTTLLWFALSCIHARAGVFNETLDLYPLVQLLVLACNGASILLVILCVQQDIVPGVRGDWLSRPVSRSDLLLAKGLFAALTVGVPRLVMNMGLSLLYGHDVIDAAMAGFAGATATLMVALPFFAIAALSENLIQAILAAFVVVVGVSTTYLFINISSGMALDKTGAAWILEFGQAALATVGGITVLLVQYLSRRTAVARGLFCIVVALTIAGFSLPWTTAFAIQSRLSPDPRQADVVKVSYDPSAGKYQGKSASYTAGYILRLPVRINVDANPESLLLIDFLEVRLLDAQGNLLKTKRVAPYNRGVAQSFQLGKDQAQETLFQGIALNKADYNRLKSAPVRIELNYAFTLFTRADTDHIATTLGQSRSRLLGKCAAKASESSPGQIMLYCYPSADLSTCLSREIKLPSAGGQSDVSVGCRPDYKPAFMKATAAAMPGSGVIIFPFAATQIPGASLDITTYKPQAHFMRKIVTPSVRLSELTEEKP